MAGSSGCRFAYSIYVIQKYRINKKDVYIVYVIRLWHQDNVYMITWYCNTHIYIYIIYFSIFIHTGKRKKQLCERACHTRISTTSLHDRLFHWNAHSRTSSTILSTSSNVIMTCAKIVCTRKTGNILINWIDRWYISRLYKNFWSILTFQRAPGQGPELWYPPWIWLNKVFQLTSQKGRERDQHLNLRTGSHL